MTTTFKHSADSIKENDNKSFVTKAEKLSWNNNLTDFSSFKEDTSNKFKQVQALLGITVKINSDSGVIFKNGQGVTTLTAQVFKGTEDITDTIQAANFKWTRNSGNPIADQHWNDSHAEGSKSIEVNGNEINSSTTFNVTIL